MWTYLQRFGRLGLIFLGLCASSQSLSWAKDGPESRTKQLVSALQARHASAKTSNSDAAQRVDAELDGLFDFDRLCSDPIAPHKKAFKPAQLKTFQQAFHDLIRSKALHAGGALAEGTLSIAAAVMEGEKARVDVRVVHPEKDIDSHITFVWEDEASQWRVVDVALDGSSVVKDYQNQFGRILKKDGPDGLIKKIRARLDDARQAK